jgi:hypothetical protein
MSSPSSDEEKEIKQIYTEFGHTAFEAQNFETGLVNLLSLMAAINTPGLDRKMLSDLFNLHSRHTLGKLLKEVKKYVKLTPESEHNFQKALDYRNFLMHGFYYERITKFPTSEGRQEVIEELVGLRSLFSVADQHIQVYTDAISKHLGINEALLTDAANNLFGEEFGQEMSEEIKKHT